MLHAHVVYGSGGFKLDVDLSASERGVTVLVGASGSGKSTTLDLLAGVRRPDRGRIELDGEVYYDFEQRTWVPSRRRAIGYVLQDGVLFPHLSAERNVAFGLEAQGTPKSAARAKALELLERLGIVQLAHVKPDALSGGEKQRVALARALILEPRLLLLDEPLAALDQQTKQQVRGEVRQVIRDAACTTVVVTHDPFEAMALGDRLAVLEMGAIVQIGTREELLRHPRSPHIAHLMGLNFFSGRVAERRDDGLVTVHVPGGDLRIVDAPATSGDVIITVDPRDITLHPAPPVGTAQNVFRGAIREIAPEPPRGDRLRVVVATHPVLVAEISAHAAQALHLSVGTEVYASFKATGARVYPA